MAVEHRDRHKIGQVFALELNESITKELLSGYGK